MRPRQSTSHSEAVSRRLELLGDELRSVTGASGASPPAPATPDDHTRIRPGGPADPWAPRLSSIDDDLARLTTLPAREDLATPAAVASPTSPVPAPALPAPGRHAARRRPRVFDLTALRGRVALTSAHVAVFAVLVAVGMAVTTWWVIRDDPGQPLANGSASRPLTTPVEPPGGAASDDAPVEASGSDAPSSGGESTTELVVDVAGKVRSPGIVVLEPGSRVVDAIDGAGGARRGVDLTGLNLARPLQDGEQILVGVSAPPGVAASSVPQPEGSDSGGELININTASSTELEELSGVGPVTAEAIIEWRTDNGGFASVDQLLEVDGIGEKTLADLAPHVTVG